MTIHPNFVDWYRSAAVTPPEGLLEKRWAGVEKALKWANEAHVVDLAKLFTLPKPLDSAVPGGFRELFRSQDETFPSKNNLVEMKVLAGAVLRAIIDGRDALAPIAALALLCGSFGPRKATLPERDHFETADRFLAEYGNAIRDCTLPPAVKIPNLSKKRFEELLQEPIFAQNQLQPLREPLFGALTEIAGSLTTAVKQAQQAIEQLSRIIQVRDEEVNILWWLQTRFSRYLEISFSECGYVAGTLVFPMELADLTIFVPGSESTKAVLAHALQWAGAPSVSETTTIAQATNTTPRKWRERIRSEHELGKEELLCPVMLAIHRSLDTDGPDEWLPVYRKVCDIPSDIPVPLIHIAVQLFRERMLLKAVTRPKS